MCCIMGVTLTIRIGEFRHVLVQVLMQSVQLPHVPAGHCFKQIFSAKFLLVCLVGVHGLALDPSVNNKHWDTGKTSQCGDISQHYLR